MVAYSARHWSNHASKAASTIAWHWSWLGLQDGPQLAAHRIGFDWNTQLRTQVDIQPARATLHNIVPVVWILVPVCTQLAKSPLAVPDPYNSVTLKTVIKIQSKHLLLRHLNITVPLLLGVRFEQNFFMAFYFFFSWAVCSSIIIVV